MWRPRHLALPGALGLPGIGTKTAHLMTHKVAMRRRLAEGGVPQPQFAAIRAWREAAAAADTVGFPAVLKPADSGGQRGLFLLRQERQRLIDESMVLDVEVAKMMRLDRLQELARRHNLVQPKAGQYVDLEPKADQSLASLEPKAQ